MTQQELKNSILQEAIEGRLVPQDPNDEPASVLLDKIRAEKKQLVKEKKLKKSALKEDPITDDDKLFIIPETWEWCKLGWIGDWGAGATPAKGTPEFYTNGTIPWLRTGELNNGIVIDSEIKVTPYALQKCSLRECKVGDVLIAMYGATIGKVAIAGIELTTNQACCACTPYQVYNKFLLFYLMASKQRFIELGEGGAQPNISREKIVAFPFPLPPLAEQKRIVAKIEELLPKVEEYGKAQESLDKLNEGLPERLKKSILQEAIEGRLVPQDPNDEPASVLLDKIRKEKAKLVKEGKLKMKDLVETPIEEDEIPFKIPESWAWVRLKGITTKIVDGDHNPPRGLSYDTGYYMLSSKNINNNAVESLSDIRFISFEDWKKCNERTQLSKGDLLLTTVATLGRSCVYEDDVPYCFQRSVSIISTMIFNYFLKFCFDSPFYQSQIEDKATGTAQKGFYLYQLEESIIPLPPLAEQHRIVEKIEQILNEIDKLKA